MDAFTRCRRLLYPRVRLCTRLCLVRLRTVTDQDVYAVSLYGAGRLGAVGEFRHDPSIESLAASCPIADAAEHPRFASFTDRSTSAAPCAAPPFHAPRSSRSPPLETRPQPTRGLDSQPYNQVDEQLSFLTRCPAQRSRKSAPKGDARHAWRSRSWRNAAHDECVKEP